MQWWLVLSVEGVLLMVLFAMGMPVAFAFLALNVAGFVIIMKGFDSLNLVVTSAYDSVSVFTLVAVPLFILMGQMLYTTGLASIIIDSAGKWVGRIPGSLTLIAVAAGTMFGMMSGSGMSGTALLGSTIVPEMKRRGYAKAMIYGPIMGSGGLATIIPPSNMAIIVAVLAQISAGSLLIACFIPGIVLAALYMIYVLVRSQYQPKLAPAFVPPNITWGDRFKSLLFMSPLLIIIFLVLGLIFLGVCTPSEAAAFGAAGAFCLTAAYGKLRWQAVKQALSATCKVTGMVFMILLNAAAFTQSLAYTGTTRQLGELAANLPVSPIWVVFAMMGVLLVLGMFIDDLSMVMITIPVFFPVIRSLGINTLWFALLMMVAIQLGTVTPPFGLQLFAMKAIAPKDITMADIYLSSLPICLIILVLLLLIIIFPPLATWLPGLMD